MTFEQRPEEGEGCGTGRDRGKDQHGRNEMSKESRREGTQGKGGGWRQFKLQQHLSPWKTCGSALEFLFSSHAAAGGGPGIALLSPLRLAILRLWLLLSMTWKPLAGFEHRRNRVSWCCSEYTVRDKVKRRKPSVCSYSDVNKRPWQQH